MARAPLPVNAPLPRRGLRRAAAAPLLALAMALGACTDLPLFAAPREVRGHMVEADMLRELTPGVQTRADVAALLGTPSAMSTFNDEEWFYISGITRPRPGRKPLLESQRVVALRFDQTGVLQSVRELTEADARNVQMVERETPVPGTERSFLQALFGNLGSLGPGAGVTQSGQPGAQ